MIGAIAFALLQAAAAPAAPPVVTWVVQPDSVTVAEPFTVTVRVRASRDLPVVFPAGPDSAQAVEAVDPPVIGAEEKGDGITERIATYRLMAWETGPVTVPLAPLTVGAAGAAQSIPLAPVVVVRTVLPADSTLRVPRPALDILPAGRALWPWLFAALDVAVIGLLLWNRARLRRAKRPPPPHAVADEALRRIEALGLLDAGEPSRHVRLCVDALRDYLSARVAKASRSQTSGELVAALRGRALPVERLAALLADADAVQFAHRTVSTARAKEIGLEVRAVVAASEEAFARDVPVPAASKVA